MATFGALLTKHTLKTVLLLLKTVSRKKAGKRTIVTYGHRSGPPTARR